jgi:hypothetical protein
LWWVDCFQSKLPRKQKEIEAIEEAAEKSIETGHYTDEKSRYSFKTHMLKDLKAHLNIAKGTGTPLAENTRVRKLLYSIHCATMNVPISPIQAQENLSSSFDESINYLRAFILSTSHGDDCNVSGFTARSTAFKRKDGWEKIAKKRKVSSNNGNKPFGHYYKPGAWWNISEEVQAKMLVLQKNWIWAVGAMSSDRIVAAAGTLSSNVAAEPKDMIEQTTQRLKKVKFNHWHETDMNIVNSNYSVQVSSHSGKKYWFRAHWIIIPILVVLEMEYWLWIKQLAYLRSWSPLVPSARFRQCQQQ